MKNRYLARKKEKHFKHMGRLPAAFLQASKRENKDDRVGMQI